MSAPIAAAIQMNSQPQLDVNLTAARRLLRDAAERGASLAVLPENFAVMGQREADKLALAEPDGAGPIQDFLAESAATLKMWIVAGTVPLAVEGDPARVWPASLVYDAQGRRAARYDKIHLFDVVIPGGERYMESATIARGDLRQVPVVDTPLGKLGLSVCYDLRFPELYRALAEAGAEILCVPAAFTYRTGEAHWDVLLRARAIENQCYVIAPGQHGVHASGRRTWGHSMIVDPWGERLDCVEGGDGVAVGQIDPERLAQVRREFPALTHRLL
jgi:nitrilase